jgi:hypothetical protein
MLKRGDTNTDVCGQEEEWAALCWQVGKWWGGVERGVLTEVGDMESSWTIVQKQRPTSSMQRGPCTNPQTSKFNFKYMLPPKNSPSHRDIASTSLPGIRPVAGRAWESLNTSF